MLDTISIYEENTQEETLDDFLVMIGLDKRSRIKLEEQYKDQDEYKPWLPSYEGEETPF